MKSTLSRALAFVRARLAEPSTHAAVAAFLLALADGAHYLGSVHGVAVLVGMAVVAAISAACKADPKLAADATQVAAAVHEFAPVAVAIAKAEAPGEAAAIDAVAAGVTQVADQVANAGKGG